MSLCMCVIHGSEFWIYGFIDISHPVDRVKPWKSMRINFGLGLIGPDILDQVLTIDI